MYSIGLSAIGAVADPISHFEPGAHSGTYARADPCAVAGPHPYTDAGRSGLGESRTH